MDFDAVASTVHFVCGQYGVDADIPEECARLIREVVESYVGELGEFEAWLSREILRRFRSFGSRPQWLQTPEWPVRKGVPLIFVGQLERSRGVHAGQYWGHDAAYYVFADPEIGTCQVVVQAD